MKRLLLACASGCVPSVCQLCVCTAAASTRAHPLPTDCKLSFDAATGGASLRWASSTLHGALQQTSTHRGQAGICGGLTGVSCGLQPAAWGVSVCASASALHCATRSRHALPLLGHLGLETKHFHANQGGPDPSGGPTPTAGPFAALSRRMTQRKAQALYAYLAFGHQSLYVY